MKIALAQLNTIIGDLSGNEAKILAAYQQGAEAAVDLVLAPELAVCGYPPRDLLHKGRFIELCWAVVGVARARGRDHCAGRTRSCREASRPRLAPGKRPPPAATCSRASPRRRACRFFTATWSAGTTNWSLTERAWLGTAAANSSAK